MATSTTTCSYSNPTIVWYNENDGYFDPSIGAQSFPTGNNVPLGPFQFGSSTCVTVEEGGGGGGGIVLSTDPLLVALVAAALVIYSASYVRRVFYS